MSLLTVLTQPPRAFTPTRLAGCRAWFAADRLIGFANNDPVGTWTDLSGLANHATQATAGRKPTFKTAIQNGRPGILFDATDDALKIVSNASLQTAAVTYVVVCKLVSAASAIRPVICKVTDGTSFNLNGYQLYFDDVSVNADLAYQFRDGAATQNVAVVGAGGTAAMILAARHNAAGAGASTSELWKNGTRVSQVTTDNALVSGTNPIFLGNQVDSGASPSNMYQFEVALFSRWLADAQLNQLFAYLGSKWGIVVA